MGASAADTGVAGAGAAAGAAGAGAGAAVGAVDTATAAAPWVAKAEAGGAADPRAAGLSEAEGRGRCKKSSKLSSILRASNVSRRSSRRPNSLAALPRDLQAPAGKGRALWGCTPVGAERRRGRFARLVRKAPALVVVVIQGRNGTVARRRHEALYRRQRCQPACQKSPAVARSIPRSPEQHPKRDAAASMVRAARAPPQDPHLCGCPSPAARAPGGAARC